MSFGPSGEPPGAPDGRGGPMLHSYVNPASHPEAPHPSSRRPSSVLSAANGPDQYYLVTAGCGLGHGSYGRDSFGVERPLSANDCP
jgi:hypothetical protein